LVWWRRFPSVPRTVTVARHAAVHAVTGWGIEEVGVADVALVVSELVTNAVRHGRVPGRLVELRLVYDLEKAVTVEVSDAADQCPDTSAPDPAAVDGFAESGRGSGARRRAGGGVGRTGAGGRQDSVGPSPGLRP
ncbi:MAG TPA: ATP-binding protein, partial [Streptomyces sp.]|nr:ATP-binding protein [Streptomyces sp.]